MIYIKVCPACGERWLTRAEANQCCDTLPGLRLGDRVALIVYLLAVATGLYWVVRR